MRKKERKIVFDYISKKEYYTKNYSAFLDSIHGYCCDHDGQKKIYDGLVEEGFGKWKSFEDFQEKTFGDFINPKWKPARKKIQETIDEVKGLDFQRKDMHNQIEFKYFVITWFLITYPLRGIYLSILWAIKTVKEK